MSLYYFTQYRRSINEARENCVVRGFITCAHHQMSFGYSDQEDLDGQNKQNMDTNDINSTSEDITCEGSTKGE
jgi:hypothetical protein